jgi:hypothetical protein
MVPFGKEDAEANRGTGDLARDRALVPVAPPPRAEMSLPRTGTPDVRPNAPFLTQLLATAAGLPQTRERRRMDPGSAISAYANAMREPAVSGHAVRESR